MQHNLEYSMYPCHVAPQRILIDVHFIPQTNNAAAPPCKCLQHAQLGKQYGNNQIVLAPLAKWHLIKAEIHICDHSIVPIFVRWLDGNNAVVILLPAESPCIKYTFNPENDKHPVSIHVELYMSWKLPHAGAVACIVQRSMHSCYD